MPTPTFEDYVNLTIEQFYLKHDADGYNAMVERMQERAKTADAKTQESIAKTLAGFKKKNLSPSMGAYLGFVVQDDANAAPEVVFMTFDDARKRGLRLNVNGTAEKVDATAKDTLMREVQEELMHNAQFNNIFADVAARDLEKCFPLETKKYDLARLEAGKFCYYSCQFIIVDQARVYKSAELTDLIAGAQLSVRKLQEIVKPLIALNLLAEPMAQHAALVEQAKAAAKELIEWTVDSNGAVNPLRAEEKAALQAAFEAGDEKKLKSSINENVMAYTEANGFGFVSWKELIAHPQIQNPNDKAAEKKFFAPNAESLNEALTAKGAAMDAYLADAVAKAVDSHHSVHAWKSNVATSSTSFADNQAMWSLVGATQLTQLPDAVSSWTALQRLDLEKTQGPDVVANATQEPTVTMSNNQ